MNAISKIGLRTTTVLATLTLITAAIGGCEDNNGTTATTDYTYEDGYNYQYYYPADLAYTGMYAADSWDYATLVAQTAGYSSAVATRPTVGSVVRALVRGESVCPNQVTVTPKTAAPACAQAGVTAVRNGITVVFNGCQVANGGTISGTFDVTANRSASDATCGAGTIITLGHTTTITNLTYTSPTGGRIVIPSQVDTGSTMYTFGQSPATSSIKTDGEVQLFASGGNTLADRTYSGTRTFTFSGNQSFTIDGAITSQDKVTSGTATLTGTGLVRSVNCCRPTGGTLVVNRSGGVLPGTHTWTFGPACGAASFDGTNITLPICQ
jgi:hypothetical protein